MRRDIDFNRLRALPGRQVANAAAGQTIVEQGGPAGPLRVVVNGRVQLRRDGATIAELGPGELFGEVALVGGGAQPYEAVATAATTLLVLPAEAVAPLLGAAGAFPLGLAQTLADRAAQLAGTGAKAAGGSAAPASGRVGDPPRPSPQPAASDAGPPAAAAPAPGAPA